MGLIGGNSVDLSSRVAVAGDTMTGPLTVGESFGIGINNAGGSGKARVTYDGVQRLEFTATQMAISAASCFGWSSTSYASISNIDTQLVRLEANRLALARGTNPQRMDWYNTHTGGFADSESVAISWAANVANLQTHKTGTGTQRGLCIQDAAGTLAFFGGTPAAQPAAPSIAEESHTVSASFDNAEVAGFLDSLGTAINDLRNIITALNLAPTS